MSFIDFILVCFKDHYKMECIYKMNDIAAHTLALFCSFPTKLKQSKLLCAKYGSKQRCRAQIITHLVIKTNQLSVLEQQPGRVHEPASHTGIINEKGA